MKLRTITIGAIAAIVLAATAQSGAHSPIEQRIAAMKVVGQQMRTLGGMAQGKIAYDDFGALSALEQMREAAATAQPLFVAPSTMGEETRAKPEIWAADSDFDSRMTQLLASLDAAIAAEPADQAAFLPLFGAVAGGCKGCHEKYRAPEDE